MRTLKPWVTVKSGKGFQIFTWWLGRKKVYVLMVADGAFTDLSGLDWWGISDRERARPVIDHGVYGAVGARWHVEERTV